MAGSFGVSFSIGERAEQLPLFPEYVPEKVEVETIINEVLTCFEMLQENELEALKERFPNEDYLENFIGVARQMAPDGEAIKGLGLSAKSNGKQRTVGLNRNRKEIRTPSKLLEVSEGDGDSDRERIKLEGILKLADSLRIEGKHGIVKLRNDEENKTYSVRVPLTQMQDVVQPYYEEYVIITGYRMGQKFYLEDIDIAEAPQ
jgi:hypothetical protein